MAEEAGLTDEDDDDDDDDEEEEDEDEGDEARGSDLPDEKSNREEE